MIMNNRKFSAYPVIQGEIMKVSNKLTKKLGFILLAVWLILTGLLQLVSIQIPYKAVIMSVLAIAAGVLILFDR